MIPGNGTLQAPRRKSTLVGALSDTHGRLDPAILELFVGVNHIVHAGDIEDATILQRLGALASVTTVDGNCDGGGDLGQLPGAATVTFGGLMVRVRHAIEMVEALDGAILASMRQAGRRVVIYGYTHVPVTSREDGILLLDPGSASLRRYETPRSVALLRIERAGVCSGDPRAPARRALVGATVGSMPTSHGVSSM